MSHTEGVHSDIALLYVDLFFYAMYWCLRNYITGPMVSPLTHSYISRLPDSDLDDWSFWVTYLATGYMEFSLFRFVRILAFDSHDRSWHHCRWEISRLRLGQSSCFDTSRLGTCRHTPGFGPWWAQSLLQNLTLIFPSVASCAHFFYCWRMYKLRQLVFIFITPAIVSQYYSAHGPALHSCLAMDILLACSMVAFCGIDIYQCVAHQNER